MSELQTKTMAAIKQYSNTYSTMYTELDANYQELQKGRSQFPSRFIDKKNIRIHLQNLNEKNTRSAKSLDQKIQKIKAEMEMLEKKIEAEDDMSLKSKLEDDYVKVKNSLTLTSIAARASKKLTLDVTDSRVDYFYEDLLLFAANCKHEALELLKMCMAVSDDVSNNVEYYQAFLLVEVADEYMREKGFNKLTAEIRTAYLNSRIELKELKTIADRISSLKDIAKKLLDAFESDEVNFRKFAERKNLIGM